MVRSTRSRRLTAHATMKAAPHRTEAMQLMVEGDEWELYIPSELAYGDSGQGGDIGAGDVLVFTLRLMTINGASKPAERGPPPYTELSGEQRQFTQFVQELDAGMPKVLAVLRQPIATSKLFLGFKAAARVEKKTADSVAYALTAASKFEKGKYTSDEIAVSLKLSAPGIFAQAAGAEWVKCKTGRPTESTVDEIKQRIESCVVEVGRGKTEL
uniref:peptidylprolyl isomerase n=1 Tax=Haptolina ericina TaxID=156174 RepID=A0A7S3B2X9_9EUKA|mmetsp:Transcript_45110/g.101883  ORF Transcript_45110/g.101883 Transcript_45110/m.101883 type:complete len:213 (+) Transcript_45110:187-825(+)